jgi:ankyrin repeat protein
MSILNLANEILFLIVKDLELPDLNSLLQANRRLSMLLTPSFRKLMLKGDNAPAALYCAAAANANEDLVRLLLEEGEGISVLRDIIPRARPIHTAPGKVDDDTIRFVLSQKANLVLKNGIALHWAAAKGRKALAKLLLDQGANIRSQDREGMTALHVAASIEDGSVVRLLLDNGAYVDSKDHGGMTPLHVAASRGHEMAVRLLLEGGADINAQDGRKWSPLHLAALGGIWR